MAFNTGNPIGSTDARDLSDNAENLDIALGTLSPRWKDRFGNNRDSFEGRLAKGSFYRVGTFSAGYTLTNMRQTLEYGGHEYSWSGTFPKVVAAGATPTSSGGIGAGAWVDRTDDALRGDIGVVFKCFNSVSEMVSDQSLQPGQYVKTVSYYYSYGVDKYGSSGGNTYVIENKSAGSFDDGGSYIFLANGNVARGLFENGVDVLQFGAKRDGVSDDTIAIQSAIDYSRRFVAITAGLISAAGPVVRVPAGVYAIKTVTRKSGVTIEGEGSRSTYFVSLPQSPGVTFGAFEISTGPVVASHLRGVCICGGATTTSNVPTNSWQYGIYTHAKWDTNNYPLGCGLWYSNYEDVYVKSFKFGEWSRAGYTWANSLRPNQFISYINCTFLVTTDGVARRFTGQHGQISIIGGDNGGLSGLVAERAIMCYYDPDPSTTADNNSGYGESTSDTANTGDAVRAPELIKFTGGASIQRSKIGCQIENSEGVSFDSCWFESLGAAFSIRSDSSVSVTNSRFANAADGNKLGGAGGGYLIDMSTSDKFDFGIGNVIRGTLDNIFEPGLDFAVLHKLTTAPVNRSTLGKTNVLSPPQYTATSTGLVTLRAFKDVFVRAYQSDLSVKIENIDSFLMPGEILIIRAWNGPITLKNTGNINLLGSSEVTVGLNGKIMLTRTYNYSSKDFELVSIYNPPVSSAPTSGGYYAKGTMLYKTDPAPGASPGWICTTAGLAGSGAVFTQMPALLSS